MCKEKTIRRNDTVLIDFLVLVAPFIVLVLSIAISFLVSIRDGNPDS